MSAGGINAQLGYAEETTPGTAVTVTRFGEFDDESITQDKARVKHSGLRTNRKTLGSNNYFVGRETDSGDIDMMLQYLGQAVFFKHALGAVTTTTPGGGTLSRQHLCKEGAIDGKALTVQVNLPDDTGTSRPKTFAGTKIAKWRITQKENENPVLKLSLDGMTGTFATAIATASYPTGQHDYDSTDCVVKLAGSEVACAAFDIGADNQLTLDRYYMQSTLPGTKKEQLEGAGLRVYDGNLTLAFPDLAAYNRYVNDTQASLQITWTGAILEAAIPFSFDITCPAVMWEGKTPVVKGVGLIEVDLAFTVVDTQAANGPLVVTVVNTDTAP